MESADQPLIRGIHAESAKSALPTDDQQTAARLNTSNGLGTSQMRQVGHTSPSTRNKSITKEERLEAEAKVPYLHIHTHLLWLRIRVFRRLSSHY